MGRFRLNFVENFHEPLHFSFFGSSFFITLLFLNFLSLIFYTFWAKPLEILIFFEKLNLPHIQPRTFLVIPDLAKIAADGVYGVSDFSITYAINLSWGIWLAHFWFLWFRIWLFARNIIYAKCCLRLILLWFIFKIFQKVLI